MPGRHILVPSVLHEGKEKYRTELNVDPSIKIWKEILLHFSLRVYKHGQHRRKKEFKYWQSHTKYFIVPPCLILLYCLPKNLPNKP